MSIYNENILSLLVLIGCLYIVLYFIKKTYGERLEAKGIFIDNLTIMFKTAKINGFIEKLANSGTRFWKIFSTIGIFIGIYLMILGTYFLHINILKFLYVKEEAAPIVPVIPFITLGIEELPFLIISFIITLIFHEFAHGVIAISEKIPVKSSGIFFFILFLGGFIEPDENILNKRKLLSKLRVYSAGSFSNYIIGLLFSLLLATFFIQSNGILVMDVMQNYPAYHYLKRFDVIIEINGTNIKNVDDLSLFMNNTKPGQYVNVKIIRDGSELNYVFKLGERDGRGLIGITVSNNFDMIIPLSKPIVYNIYKIFLWIAVVNTSVAVINMLPIAVFDGGLSFSAVIDKYIGKRRLRNILKTGLSVYFIAILLVNILFTFIYKKYWWIWP